MKGVSSCSYMRHVCLLLLMLTSVEALAQQSLTSVKTQLDAMFAEHVYVSNGKL